MPHERSIRMAQTTVEVLRAARARYEARPDHTPYPLTVTPGCDCLVSACVNAACDLGHVGHHPALAALAAAVGVSFRPGVNTHLIKWNATHSTEQGLAAFDRAIAAEETRVTA